MADFTIAYAKHTPSAGAYVPIRLLDEQGIYWAECSTYEDFLDAIDGHDDYVVVPCDLDELLSDL